MVIKVDTQNEFGSKSKWDCYFTLVEEIHSYNQFQVEEKLTGKVIIIDIDNDIFDDIVLSRGLAKDFISYKEFPDYIIRFYSGKEIGE